MLQNSFHPCLIIQIPLHRFADAGLEGVRGRPAEFVFDFRGVNGVTAVMTEAVFYKCNQLA